MKRCNRCGNRKAEFLFPVSKKSTGGYGTICKRCENRRQKMAREAAKDWKYPYKGMNDPKYIEDRAKCFAVQAKRERKLMGLNW